MAKPSAAGVRVSDRKGQRGWSKDASQHHNKQKSGCQAMHVIPKHSATCSLRQEVKIAQDDFHDYRLRNGKYCPKASRAPWVKEG